MRDVGVPAVLADQLGEAGSVALAAMFHENSRAIADDVMALCAERFERRLVEETSKLRVETAQLGATLRQEMAQMKGDLRGELAVMGSDLRRDIADMRGDFSQELAINRFELLKWAFLFWVGQLVSVVGLVGLMLRTMTIP